MHNIVCMLHEIFLIELPNFGCVSENVVDGTAKQWCHHFSIKLSHQL